MKDAKKLWLWALVLPWTLIAFLYHCISHFLGLPCYH